MRVVPPADPADLGFFSYSVSYHRLTRYPYLCTIVDPMSNLNSIAVLSLVICLVTSACGHLSAEKRCQSICQMTELDEQCKYCNARSPVRFGKRSNEFHMTLRSSSTISERLQSLNALARILSMKGRYRQPSAT
ncbi:Hypothetical protein NTJ_06467 [Nesidiocoris tenuis]|uniref:Laminin EGF-like domain-containing protein n=1 Tax=Nesidiocoris tenuis TaxID=355587 RepID=A0ABN7AN48_9HEMI|nr:Hypothetical protein NTJ_06467 [Nesidiocoris tenuis]